MDDPAAARVLMYGGTANGTHLTDLWSWNGSSWTMLSASGGPALGHAAGGWDVARSRLVVLAYDASRSQLVLFGRHERERRGTRRYVGLERY